MFTLNYKLVYHRGLVWLNSKWHISWKNDIAQNENTSQNVLVLKITGGRDGVGWGGKTRLLSDLQISLPIQHTTNCHIIFNHV